MVAIFDPNIFYQGAALQQANQDRLSNTFQNILGMYMQNQERKQKQLDLQKAESMKPENIGVQLMQGLPVTPEQQAVYDFWQAERLSQQAIDPTTGMMYSKYTPIEGTSIPRGANTQLSQRTQSAADMLFPQGGVPTPTMGGAQRQSVGGMLFPDVAGDGMYNIADEGMLPPIVEEPYAGQTNMVRPEQTPTQRVGTGEVAEGLMSESGLKQTPVGRKMLLESGIRINEKSLEKEIDFAKEQLKSEKGKQQINNKIAELVRINSELQKEGALMTEQGGVKNLLTMATGTGLGGAAEAALSPKTAQLRKDYENAVGGIIPYYIAANNLPATVVDTEEFAQRIINAFGNPSGFYSTNVEALRRASEEFGGKTQQNQQQDPLGLFQ